MPLADHAAARRQQLEQSAKMLKQALGIGLADCDCEECATVEGILYERLDAAFTAGAIAGREESARIADHVEVEMMKYGFPSSTRTARDIAEAIRAIAPPDRETT